MDQSERSVRINNHASCPILNRMYQLVRSKTNAIGQFHSWAIRADEQAGEEKGFDKARYTRISRL